MRSATTAVRFEERVPQGAEPVVNARYKLASRLDLVEQGGGGILLSLHPLLVMRLNATGFALVKRLSPTEARSLDDVVAEVPALSTPEAEAFLECLSRRSLVSREPVPPAAWPAVSVIVAARGRPSATRACIESLLSLNYARERIEVLLVDDASEPPLAEAVAGLPVPVVRLDRNVGQSAARNLAATRTSGELLAFIDNDCEAAPDWLHRLVPHFRDPSVAAVGGRVVAPPPKGLVAAFEAARSPLDMGPTEAEVGPDERVAYLPSCNLVVRRDALLTIGGFAADMRVGEDVDLVWRLLNAGARVRYAAAADVVHDHRVQLGALLARRADYGASEADLQTRHPRCRATMQVPRASLFVLTAVVSVWSSAILGAALALMALGLVSAELAGKRRRIQALRIEVATSALVASVLREHAASFYHFGHHVARYYGLPLVTAGLLWPPLLSGVAMLLTVPPVCDHRRLKPAVPLPAFVALYWLEMAAYQLGVWRGCIARRCWRPLFPQVRWCR